MEIKRNKILNSFYQPKAGRYTCKGLGGNERKVTLKPTDILVKSGNGKYFNRINKGGLVNLVIPNTKVTQINERLEFTNYHYEKGYQSI